MVSNEIKNTVLLELYKAELAENGESNINKIQTKYKFDKEEYKKVIERLTHEGCIKPWAMGGKYRITSEGILHAEETSIIPNELSDPNISARTDSLIKFAEEFEENGRFNRVHYQPLCEQLDMEPQIFVRNMKILIDYGYIESVGSGSYRITPMGLDSVEEWRNHNSIVDKFDEVKQLSPQPRGKAFEKVFSDLLQSYNWQSDQGVVTSHEELDLVFNKGRDYYLVECKWKKDPIQAKVVRDVYAKLENRDQINGIVVSMSNFSSGCIKQVKDYANKKIILLFGEKDVHNLLYRNKTFDSMLDHKYKALITRKEVVYE